MSNIFEKATKNKYRFPFKGMISVEDLWDLNMNSLDSIYKTLCAQKKSEDGEESLMVSKSPVDDELATKIEIVKYIFGCKAEAKKAAEMEAENKIKKQKILGVIAAKEDEALKNTSLEDLKKMLEEI